MELTNQTTCPKCSQNSSFNIDNLRPMKLVWAEYESEQIFRMKCPACGSTWNFPKGVYGT